MWNGTEKVFFVGICGISLSALALVLKAQGHEVKGSDSSPGDMKEKLEAMGIEVFCKHCAQNVDGADVVVYSAAISKDNPELLRAKKLGKIVLSRAQLLGEFSRHFAHTIAISGSHGKTTTTAMIASILIDAGKDPTVHVGGIFSKIGGNVRVGKSDFFVTEACEYCDSFLQLSPEVGVILNVQADHLDYFKTIARVEKSFGAFAGKTQKLLVFGAEDNRAKRIAQKANCKTMGFSVCESADVCAKKIMRLQNGCFSFEVESQGKVLGKVSLSVPGAHNIKNALAAIAVALFFDVPFEIISQSLGTFSGVDRRFELVGKMNGALVYHDYAHHPTEIDASIEAARMIASGKLYVVFQPHTFSRTKSFWNDFAKSLAKADEVVLFPIYPAREEPIEGVSSDKLAKEVAKNGTKSVCLHSHDEVLEHLDERVQKGDLVLILGAGDIVDITKLI